MKKVLDDIRSGKWAAAWIEENATGRKGFRGHAQGRTVPPDREGRRATARHDAVPASGDDHRRGREQRDRRARMAKTRSAEDPAAVQARESRRLSTLLEVSQALSGTLNLKSALHRVLEILAKHHGAVRSLIVLPARQRRTACRGLRRPRRAVARGPLPPRRGHHRQGRRERPADRRAARQPGAGVPEPRGQAVRSSRRRSSASSACRSC